MPRNVVVFGGSGQLGVELAQVFRERGCSVNSFSRQVVDITDGQAVELAIGRIDPDTVVNAAAYNQVDVAEKEPEKAYAVNALAVRNIALACRQTGARLIHFSTDYVFDGAKGEPYVEDDLPHPLGAYGVSKLAGEYYARAYLDHPLIIRTSGVFGPGGLRTNRGNFIELMLRLARNNSTVRVVEDHSASPTYAPALAARTADLVERGESGIFHIGGGTVISWYAYARMIFEAAGVQTNLIPTNEREFRTAARRPKLSGLRNAKLDSSDVAPMPPLEEAIQDYFRLRGSV